MKAATIRDCEVHLVKGDITEQSVDAIVNAANSTLMGGGGVDGAIHRKGGVRILEECKEIRKSKWPKGLPTGEAVITTGGDLPAKQVIHTVGPVWRGGGSNEKALLANAYKNSLELALSMGLRSIAFPSISTGAYGYPVNQASRIALWAIKNFLERRPGLDRVIVVLFSEADFLAYTEASETIFKAGPAPIQ